MRSLTFFGTLKDLQSSWSLIHQLALAPYPEISAQSPHWFKSLSACLGIDPVSPSVPIEGGLPVTPLWFVDWVNLQWNKIKITESHKRRHLKTKILKSRFVWRFGANHESWPFYQMFLFHHRLQKGNLASPSLILHFMTFSWHEMKAILDLEQNLLT